MIGQRVVQGSVGLARAAAAFEANSEPQYHSSVQSVSVKDKNFSVLSCSEGDCDGVPAFRWPS